MKASFKYKYNRKSKRDTLLSLLAVGVIVTLLLLYGEGSYLMACLTAIFIALVLLCLMSIPRKIIVTEDALDIRCVVELTHLEIGEIASIRRAYKWEYDRMIMVLGGFGLFGYYGFYFNFRRWDMYKVYATEWDYLVEIEDIYEQRYIVSCREAEKLIELVEQNMAQHKKSRGISYEEWQE